MTAPSNANTSGLEVVAWRWKYKGTDWVVGREKPSWPDDVDERIEPLANAIIAQARIEAAEADIGYQVALRKAAEARADRLAKGMPDLSSVIGWLASGCDPTHAVDELRIYQARIDAALQQEKQP